VHVAFAGDGASTLIGPGNPSRYFGPFNVYHRLLGVPGRFRAPFAAAAGAEGWWRRLVPRSRQSGSGLLQKRLAAISAEDLYRLGGGGPCHTYFPAAELSKMLAFDFEPRRGYFHELERIERREDALQHLTALAHFSVEARSACDRMFVRVNGAAAAAALGISLPFCDHWVVEFAERLPARLKYRHGSKYLFKKLVHRYIPEKIVAKPKMGFETPSWHWFRTDLSELLGYYLDPIRLRSSGFFNLGYVSALKRRCLEVPDPDLARLYTSRLRQVLMFQMWYERWG